MTTAKFEAYDAPRAGSAVHPYKVLEVPTDWIDEMGLPTHGMGDIAAFLQRERAHLMRTSPGLKRPMLNFCYFYRSLAYAGVAELIPGEGLVLAVTAPHMLARMTSSDLTYNHLHLLPGRASGDSMSKKERYRLVSDRVTEKPRWALSETSEFKVTRHDHLERPRYELADCSGGEEYVQGVTPRPATALGIIQEISRALKSAERSGRWGQLKVVRRVRSLLGEQGRETSMDALVAMSSPITADDAVFYDECRDMVFDAINDELSFWQLVGKLGLYAHTRLPQVYGDRFMERWTTGVLAEQPDLETLRSNSHPTRKTP